MDFNGSEPDVLGLEVVPRAGQGVPSSDAVGAEASQALLPALRVGSVTDGVAVRWSSTVTETVTEIGVHRLITGSTPLLVVETFEFGDHDPPVSTLIYLPNEVNVNDTAEDVWQTPTASSVEADLLAELDHETPFDGEYVAYNPNNTASGYADEWIEFAFPTDDGSLTGKRILDVRVVLWGYGGGGRSWRVDDTNTAPWGFTDPLFDVATETILTTPPRRTVFSVGEGWYDPGSGHIIQPFTVAVLEALDTGTPIRLAPQAANSGLFGTALNVVRLEVDVCDETRQHRNIIGSIFGIEPLGISEWVTFTPEEPDDTANWDKVSGDDLITVIRQPRTQRFTSIVDAANFGSAIPVMHLIDDQRITGYEVYDQTVIDVDHPQVADLGDARTDRLIGLDISTAGGQSADAQPYVSVRTILVDGTTRQGILSTDAGDYDGVLLPLKFVGDSGDSGTLTIALKRVSDDVTMGTATVTRADAEGFDEDYLAGWRQTQAEFASAATLAAATGYYLDFTTTGDLDWHLASLSTRDYISDTNAEGDASYGGETYRATIDGTGDDYQDLAATVYIQPDPPDDLTVTADLYDISDDPTDTDIESCPIDGVPFVRVTIDPSTQTNFAYHEIQRMDPSTEWQTIAQVTDATTSPFVVWDIEARVGVESTYRVRVVNDFGVTSDWSSEESVTVPTIDTPGYLFTSNEDPAGAVAYPDVYGDGLATRSYQWDDAFEVAERSYFGRDYLVAHRPSEWKGDRFTRRLLVSSLAAPAAGFGPPAFLALRNLARSALSYVCVRDERGGRWFASVTVPQGQTVDPAPLHTVEVQVVEVTATPSLADVVTVE